MDVIYGLNKMSFPIRVTDFPRFSETSNYKITMEDSQGKFDFLELFKS